MEFTNLLVVFDHKSADFGNVCISDLKFSENSEDNIIVNCENLVAYPGLINIHDHLVGNWLPKTAPNNPYPNTSIWVEEMRNTEPLKERKKFWKTNDLSDLTKDNGIDLALLGMYKNIFSGVVVIQDHVPVQNDEYYEHFPINVTKKYQQGHSITLKNWWGGEDLQTEMQQTDENTPFIIHLAEGTDKKAKSEFEKFKKMNLLKSNAILVHCTALSTEDFKKVAPADSSIAWCPNSNIYLLGTTLDFKTALDFNINMCIGTDSTISGSLNLFNELSYIKKTFSSFSSAQLFKMVTENSAKALKLQDYSGKIEIGKNANLLLTRKVKEDPYENLVNLKSSDIELLLFKGKPIFGKVEYLKFFSWDAKNYYLFNYNDSKRFVIGHPEKILQKIKKALGHAKHLDYLPF